MCSSQIAWCGFTWEAFATLVTGVLAVGAAAFVGLRQASIQKKQANIQIQSLKVDLFERRLENYETVRDLMNSLLGGPTDAIDPLLQQKFFIAMREARFLFSQTVYDGLDDIWKLCGELNATSVELNEEKLQQGSDETNMARRKYDAYLAVSRSYANLPELYAEMRLDLSGK